MLHFSTVVLHQDNFSGNTVGVRIADALQKVVYYGDSSGDGIINAPDASLIKRVSVTIDNGFYAYPLTDPVIISGVTAGTTSAGIPPWPAPTAVDASVVQIAANYLAAHQPLPAAFPIPMPGPVPVIGGGLSFAGIDPTIQIGSSNTVAVRGATVDTPVAVVGSPEGLQSATLTITYDPTRLDLNHSGVKLAPALAATGWTLVDSVEQAQGVVYVQLDGPSLSSISPELLDLAFQVPSNAPAGTSALTLTGTLDANQLVMTPIDGSITVPAAVSDHARSGFAVVSFGGKEGGKRRSRSGEQGVAGIEGCFEFRHAGFGGLDEPE